MAVRREMATDLHGYRRNDIRFQLCDFKVKATPTREGRNPSTGAAMTIAASKKLTFAPAKVVKDAINS